MPSTLQAHIRQTRIIIQQRVSRRRIKFPDHWHVSWVNNPNDLLSAISESFNHAQQTLLLASESDFPVTLLFLREKLPKEILSRLGIVAISQSPNQFLEEQSHASELLDVIPEDIFRKSVDFQVMRVLRQLIKKGEREKRRIGQKTLEKLNQIFITLSAERNLEQLLATTLSEAILLTGAHGGLLYVVKEIDGELFFDIRMRNDGTPEMYLQNTKLKVSENSICGYVCLTGKLYNINDVREIKIHTFPQYSREIDYSQEDQTRSALTVPFKNSRNEIIAILQLVNKQPFQHHPEGEGDNTAVDVFDEADESLLASYATQASICLENLELYGDIQSLFNGFVRASITAIESRDPSTGGHSERVAKMTVALAEATSDCDRGIYRSVRFKETEIRELEYAALLHDFGKIGVREEVLVKAKKLYPYQLETLKERFELCKTSLHLLYKEKELDQGKNSDLEKEYHQKIAQINTYWEIIKGANDPSILEEERFQMLEQIRQYQIALPSGHKILLLNDEEFNALSVTRGSLTDAERLEVESHVRHTYQYLKMIPWTKNFKNLPDIAHAHHEKLDGSGYPRGLISHEIPLQSKIMTIADIYDALTAADRWYKDAVPMDRALDIMAQEVAQGKLDPILFDIFLEKRIHELTQRNNTKRRIG